MKKARIFLSAIAVLGVVGGALAYKAKTTFTLTTIYTDCVNGTLAGNSEQLKTYTSNAGTEFKVATTTSTLGASCVDIFTSASKD
jgi:hypothetical protein